MQFVILVALEWRNRKAFDLSSGHHEFDKGAVVCFSFILRKFNGNPLKIIETLISLTIAAQTLPRLCTQILLHPTAAAGSNPRLEMEGMREGYP